LELLAAPSNDRALGEDDEGVTIYLKAVATALRSGRRDDDPKDKPARPPSFLDDPEA